MHWRIVLRTSLSLLGLTVSAAGQTEGAAPAEDPNAAAPEAPAADGAEPPPGDALPPEAGPVEPAPPEAGPPGEPDAGPPLGPGPGADPEADYEEPELPMTPPATDGLGGHFLLGAGAAYQKPLGKFGSDMRQSSQVGGGLSVTVDAGIGVSRQLVLGVWGQWFSLPNGSECDECTATGFAAGPFVRFHLVQGLRLDPWLSFAVGYRDLRLDDGTEELAFKGIDWARLQVGGDWYPAKNLGFGPFLELVSGGYFERPEVAGALRTYWQWSAGMRLVFDVPGKLK